MIDGPEIQAKIITVEQEMKTKTSFMRASMLNLPMLNVKSLYKFQHPRIL